jgi:DNA-directed RNA polymerase subunit beta
VRQLRLTFGYPFKVRLRLIKPEPIEEEVYLGEIPIMIGGGEFIINGSERVIVSQLHRSPGVDFSVDSSAAEKKLHTCRIIPERGSWVELNVSKKDVLTVRIDQSGKFSAVTLLRALDETLSTDQRFAAAILSDHGREEAEDADADRVRARAITDKIARGGHRGAEDGRSARALGHARSPETARSKCAASDLSEVEVIDARRAGPRHADHQHLHEDRRRATTKRCSDLQRLRPGNPGAAREGARAVPREVLRSPALSPRPRRPLPPESASSARTTRRGRATSCQPDGHHPLDQVPRSACATARA